ncbi:MAG: glycosyltransferase family 9 protein [Gemmatimonadaceae bacterium]
MDEILIFNRAAGLRGFINIRRQLAAKQFDLVVNLQVYFKAGIITALTHAPVKLGFDRLRARDANWLFTTHRIPAHAPQHVQDQYFEFLDVMGVAHDLVEWDLGPRPGEERAWQADFFSRLDRPAVPLVIATSKPAKDWPPERWAAVVDALYHDFELQPVLIGAPSPRERHAERVIIERARNRPISQLGSGLRKLVAVLDGSAFAIAPDTGPLHISVALNRPIVSLMGFTNPKRTGPYRRFHDLVVDAYGEPGEDYAVSADWRPGRMARITVRDVLDKVELWRSRYAGHSWRPEPLQFAVRRPNS